MAAVESPQFLTIGHITKDVYPGGYTLGGTASYASLQVSRLGLLPALVTSFGPDLQVSPTLDDISLSVSASTQSTTFENTYSGGYRTQRILGRANDLSLAQVPASWRQSEIILLGPIAAELQDDLFGAFSGSLVGLTLQGLMRGWDEAGRVYPIRWERAEELLRLVDVAILSDEDLPDQEELRLFVRAAPIVVLTHSDRGATVFDHGKPRSFPAYQAAPVDPTGAGDIFACAFLVEYERTGDLALAADFANAAASFVIEKRGFSGLPSRTEIETRQKLRKYARA